MKNILRYICSCSFFLGYFATTAQSSPNEPADTLREKAGLRIGVDIARYAFQILNPEVKGFELLTSYEFKQHLFASAAGGYEVIEPEVNNYEYKLSGYFFRLGVDYDLLQNPEDDDMVFIGARYGMSFYRQEPSQILLTSYWGEEVLSLPEENLTAQWVEIVAGINAELYFAPDVFVGWTLRGKFFSSGNEYEILTPYSIPGFAGDEKDFALGISWSVMYRIPI